MVTTPENLESPGQGISARQKTEEQYLAAIRPEVEGFMRSIRDRAVAGSLTLGIALALWQDALAKAARRLPSGETLTVVLSESDLPVIAYESATYYAAQAVSLDLPPAERALWVSAVLGLVSTIPEGVPGEPGRITTIDTGGAQAPGHRSWGAEAEGAARGAATADYASEMVEQLRAEGYTHKRWTTRYDNRVRPTHAAADRQTIPLDESFHVGETVLRYPGDPTTTDLGEIMGCRCLIVGVRFRETRPPLR